LHFSVSSDTILGLHGRATGTGSGGPTASTLGRRHSSFIRVAKVFARGSFSEFVVLIEDTGNRQVGCALDVYNMSVVVETARADSLPIWIDFTEEGLFFFHVRQSGLKVISDVSGMHQTNLVRISDVPNFYRQ
jgi:hypothetical protein